jgi:hypothetical protein
MFSLVLKALTALLEPAARAFGDAADDVFGAAGVGVEAGLLSVVLASAEEPGEPDRSLSSCSCMVGAGPNSDAAEIGSETKSFIISSILTFPFYLPGVKRFAECGADTLLSLSLSFSPSFISLLEVG